MADRSNITSWLTDMDGVLVHEGHPIPGAADLIAKWTAAGTPFLVLTNNSIYTPRDLSARLKLAGLDIPEERIWTSALATAAFLDSQKPKGTAYVIGETGMTQALHDVGYVQTDQNPDYVVLGETRNFNFDNLTKAIRLIGAGSRFIVTNPDATGPSNEGPLPAAGSVAALITKATGMKPYIVGKPNPMMFRSAMRKIGAHSESTGMIGDRMDTDVV
ncbi:MAG: HAD-IIA family hydrolase, partial [Rhodoluna sp.]